VTPASVQVLGAPRRPRSTASAQRQLRRPRRAARRARHGHGAQEVPSGHFKRLSSSLHEEWRNTHPPASYSAVFRRDFTEPLLMYLRGRLVRPLLFRPPRWRLVRAS